MRRASRQLELARLDHCAHVLEPWSEDSQPQPPDVGGRVSRAQQPCPNGQLCQAQHGGRTRCIAEMTKEQMLFIRPCSAHDVGRPNEIVGAFPAVGSLVWVGCLCRLLIWLSTICMPHLTTAKCG